MPEVAQPTTEQTPADPNAPEPSVIARYNELAAGLFTDDPPKNGAEEGGEAPAEATATEPEQAAAPAEEPAKEGETTAAAEEPAKEPEKQAAPEEPAKEPEKPAAEGDDTTASLALLARQERRLLERQKQIKAEAEEWKRQAEEATRIKAAAQLISRDPVEALRAMGHDPLQIYRAITDAFVEAEKRGQAPGQGAPNKPEEQAAAAIPEVAELKKTVEQLQGLIVRQQQEAMVEKWRADVLGKLASGMDRYPHLNRLGSNDALDWISEAYITHAQETGAPPPLDSFLPLVENEVAKLATRLAGQSHQTATPGSTTPAPTLATQEPVAQPPERTGKGTTPNTLTNELTASPSNPKPWNRDEAFADAVRLLEKGGW